MKKIIAAFLMTFALVAMVGTSANAASYKLKLTVIQTDGRVKLFDDVDQSQKGGDKRCADKGHMLWNASLWMDGLVDKLVTRDTKIKVLGASGQTVGVGKLTTAKFVKTDSYEDENPEIGFVVEGYCMYGATISVKSSDFYEIKIGKLEALDFSLAELKKKKWSHTVTVSN